MPNVPLNDNMGGTKKCHPLTTFNTKNLHYSNNFRILVVQSMRVINQLKKAL